MLGDIEESYRRTLPTHSKHKKRLSNYIGKLVQCGRYLEAGYYFSDLYEISSDHKKTIKLGYSIAIHSFDNDGVLKYDKLLVDSGSDFCELMMLRLRYYHSRNNLSACEVTSCELLDKKLAKLDLSAIVEICIGRQSYLIAEPLARHLVRNRLVLPYDVNKLLKEIIIIKLIEIIRCVK